MTKVFADTVIEEIKTIQDMADNDILGDSRSDTIDTGDDNIHL